MRLAWPWLALALAGCGGGPEVAPVEGVLRVNGRPMGKVFVQFHPDPDRGTTGPSSSAVTDDEGRFRLRYDTPGGAEPAEGAVVGWHRVVLADYSRFDDGSGRAPPSKIPDTYWTVLHTPLRAEVKRGQPPVTLDVP
jgi:hypothetical protein